MGYGCTFNPSEFASSARIPIVLNSFGIAESRENLGSI